MENIKKYTFLLGIFMLSFAAPIYSMEREDKGSQKQLEEGFEYNQLASNLATQYTDYYNRFVSLKGRTQNRRAFRALYNEINDFVTLMSNNLTAKEQGEMLMPFHHLLGTIYNFL